MTTPSGPMAPEAVRRSIAFLTGEVHALFMFSQAVAKLLSDHSLVLARIDEIDQLGCAMIAPEPVPDATVEGFQFAIEGIRKAAKAAAGLL